MTHWRSDRATIIGRGRRQAVTVLRTGTCSFNFVAEGQARSNDLRNMLKMLCHQSSQGVHRGISLLVNVILS